VWSWSSTPDRLLDVALRRAASLDPSVQLVETSDASTMAANILAMHLDGAAGQRRLVAVIQLQITDRERVVHTSIVEADAAVSNDLPGDAAEAMGGLLARVASMCYGALHDTL
jgi:hypothetical protein